MSEVDIIAVDLGGAFSGFAGGTVSGQPLVTQETQ